MKDDTPRETGLKLTLPSPAAEAEIIAALEGQAYRIKRLKAGRNLDLYLDTFDWSLYKEKLSLRYRIAGGQARYTLKAVGSSEEGSARRQETDCPLDAPLPKPAEIPAKKIAELVDGLIRPRRLIEQFLIRTDRRPFRLTTPEGAEVELVFATSSFTRKGLQGPRNARKLYELEAELASGPETALAALAALLHKTAACRPSLGTRFAVALARLKIAIPAKKPPARYAVRLEDRFDQAVRKILAHQWQRFTEQLPGIRRDIDTEFVHQARVATRRIRSALRLFQAAVPAGAGAQLAAELQWLGALLGSVRDLDVFLLNLPAFRARCDRFPKKWQVRIEALVAGRRREALADLLAGLASPRYERCARLLERLLSAPLPLRPRPPAGKPVGEAVAAIIRERFAAVMKRGREALAEPRPKRFHTLRIRMKRLRYACEFMAGAYEGSLDPFIDRTVEIQDCLGEMQDAVFTRAFLADLFAAWKGRLVEPELVFLLGALSQLQDELSRERRRQFAPIWERFAAADTAAQLEAILSGATGEKPEQTKDR